ALSPFSGTSFFRSSGSESMIRGSCHNGTPRSLYDAPRLRLRGGGRRHRHRQSGLSNQCDFCSDSELSMICRSPLLCREVCCARPPLLEEKTCCLATIMGETGDSGHSPGLDHMAF